MLVAAIFTSLLLSGPLTAKTFHEYEDLTLNHLSEDYNGPVDSMLHSSDLYDSSHNSEGPGVSPDSRLKLPGIDSIKDILQKTVLKNVEGNNKWDTGSLMLSVLQNTLADVKIVKSIVTDGLGLHEDFVKPLLKLHHELDKLDSSSSDKTYVQNINSNDSVSEAPDINWQILNAMKNVFVGEFANQTLVPLPSELTFHLDNSQNESNITASGAWMMIKSTWQRILAYVKEEHSLHKFMQLTPVRIIDKVLSIGDDVSLAGFLAQKLHPDFAKFLADGISPHLGPLKDFDTFYNYAKQYSLDGLLDYFTSTRFTHNINALSKFISAYFDDTFSDDVVDQYISFISLNNTELYNFYKSIVNNQKVKSNSGSSKTGRQKREDLTKVLSDLKYNGYDFDPKDYKTLAEKILASRDSGYGDTGYGHSDGYGHDDGGYGHESSYGGGGYGGGGYGHGGGTSMTTDPSVLLSSVALGALLGFLLFRLINGSRFFGKRDINDGSLSLWLSDLPETSVPWGTDAERMKRSVPQNDQRDQSSTGEQLPASLRGEVWSTDPFLGNNVQSDELDGEDMADHLNHLWMVYNETNEAECVQSHLCNAVTKKTAEYLTGKESSIAILLASVSNMMGVPQAGQMVDDVIQTLVVGSNYACPAQAQCIQAF